MNDFAVSLIRTWTPILVGMAITWISQSLGVDIDSTEAAVAVTGLVVAVYYGVVRWLETRYPSVGILLGSRQTPAYTEPD